MFQEGKEEHVLNLDDNYLLYCYIILKLIMYNNNIDVADYQNIVTNWNTKKTKKPKI